MQTNEENEDRDSPVDDDETTTVDLDAAPDDTDEDEGEGKLSRAEKKRERLRLREELEQERARNRDLTDRVSRQEQVQRDIQQQLAETRTQITRAQDTGDDPAEKELGDIRTRLRQLASHATALGAKLSEKEADEIQAEAERLQDRRLEIIAERTSRKNTPQRDPQEDDRRAFQMANRDVFSNREARAYAKAEFIRLTNHPNPALRKPDNQETLQLAIENTRKEFGMGRAAPTETEKARTSGVSRGGTGGGGSRDNIVAMSEFHKGLADKAYKHIKDPKERYKTWAQGPGRKMLERKRAGAKR